MIFQYCLKTILPSLMNSSTALLEIASLFFTQVFLPIYLRLGNQHHSDFPEGRESSANMEDGFVSLRDLGTTAKFIIAAIRYPIEYPCCGIPEKRPRASTGMFSSDSGGETPDSAHGNPEKGADADERCIVGAASCY